MDKFNKLVGDSEFMKKILECASTDEVKALFKSEGITVTDDELKVLADNINEAIEKNINLSDKELSNISGGLFISRNPRAVAYKLGRGVIEGAIVANIGIVKSIRDGVKHTISWIKKI